jgi:hypothetical protein
MNKAVNSIASGFAMIATIAVLSACQKGPAEKAGEKIDNAAEKTGQQIEKAGDKIQDTVKGDK